MCGLSGFLCFGEEIKAPQNILKNMGDQIYHRGPDSFGLWYSEDNSFGLVHRRLAILDLSPAGHQPMVSPTGRYVISFNGEIYNHLELRDQIEAKEHVDWTGHSDTETLLTAIEVFGLKETLKLAIGMFAFAIWDTKNKSLSLCRDRLGEKPIYHGWINGSFVFASELKAFKKFPNFKPEINKDILPVYLDKLYIPAPYSIYKNIKKLMPGTILTISKSCQEEKYEKYWELPPPLINNEKIDSDYVNELEKLLVKSVKMQMQSDVPLGAFLSGGIDSTTVVAIMQSLSKKKIKTFSIGFKEEKFNEAKLAKEVASFIGTEHQELYVTAEDALSAVYELPFVYDEPFADPSQIPTLLVSKLAKSYVTVSLSGDGGDELFCGYSRYQRASNQWRLISRLPYFFRKGIASALRRLPSTVWSNLNKLSLDNMYGDKVLRILKLFDAKSFEQFYSAHMGNWSIGNYKVIKGGQNQVDREKSGVRLDNALDYMMRTDASSYLPDDILAKVDRASMSVSLESRIPFLDANIVEFAFKAPDKVKLKNGVSKWCLKQVLFKYIPESLIDKPKRGFDIPLSDWLRGDLKNLAIDVLDVKKLAQQNIFCPKEVHKIMTQHFSNERDFGRELWSVLVLQLWIDENLSI